MTTSAPSDGPAVNSVTPDVSPHDDAAIQAASSYRINYFAHVRKRATAWVTTLTTLAGIVTTATVISAITEVGRFNQWHWVAVVVLIVGVVALVVAITYANEAAHGDGGLLEQAETIADGSPGGASAKWNTAIKDAAATLDGRRRTSVKAGASAVILMLAAFIILWAASQSGGSDTGVCVDTGGVVVEIVEVKASQTPAELTVVPCP